MAATRRLFRRWWLKRDSNPRFGLERADTDQQASLVGVDS
jgi:hypothetical protein